MRKILGETTIICKDLLVLLQKLDDQDLISYGRLLCMRLSEYQAYITVIGETSTGKSTLINGLLSYDLLPVKARPTTGTVVHLKLKDQPNAEYFAVNKDASLDQINSGIFSELAVTPDENTLRLMTCIKPKDSVFCGLNIFDTPGFNSLIEQHEDILREFIPNSDVLVFVCGYRTGFNQIDQDLFEVVRDSITDRDIPIILAINRVPHEIDYDNSKIKEITRNAEDSLHQKLSVHLIEEVNKRKDPNARPNSLDLWLKVNTIITNPKNQEMVDKTLLKLFHDFINDIINEIELRISYYSMQQKDSETLQKEHSILNQAHSQSINAVYSCSRRLKNLIPQSIEKESNNLRKSLVADIESSNKWLGKDDTFAWIQGHALPTGIKKEKRIIESIFCNELSRLDDELNQIANTAIKDIKSTIRVKEDHDVKALENITKNLLQRSIAKNVGRSLTKLGGKGGLAAGAGNFVKMATKRIGKIFGKKFPRSVYTKIGRIFNKKFVAKANYILTALVEVIDFTIESHRWKGKLIKAIEKDLYELEREVVNDMEKEYIPAIEKENLQIVDDIYLEDIQLIEKAMKSSNEELRHNITDLMDIKKDIMNKKEKFTEMIKEGDINVQ